MNDLWEIINSKGFVGKLEDLEKRHIQLGRDLKAFNELIDGLKVEAARLTDRHNRLDERENALDAREAELDALKARLSNDIVLLDRRRNELNEYDEMMVEREIAVSAKLSRIR